MSVTVANHRPLAEVRWDWASDGSGNVSEASGVQVTGRLVQFTTIPDGGGTAPTALYDVTLLNADGVDVLAGNGADRSATVVETVDEANLRPVGYSQLTLTIANAGASKGGVAVLLVEGVAE